ncbi:MAG: hypothetical protein QXO75_11030 [Nitrososphaerota archaeon]
MKDEGNVKGRGAELNYYNIILKERGEEIRLRLKNSSLLLVEIVVISIAFLETAFVHGPPSLLLALPAIVLYFLYLIFKEQMMIFTISAYLQKKC